MTKRKSGKRTASGQLSRSKAAIAQRREENERVSFENAPFQTVLMARKRQEYNFSQPDDGKKWWRRATQPVSKDEAKRLMEQGSVIDRMKGLSKEQKAAGRDHCQRYLTYAVTHGLPKPTAQGPAYGAVRGGSRPENLRKARIAKADYETDARILTQCSAGVPWAMKRACVLDEPAPERLVSEGLAALLKNGR